MPEQSLLHAVLLLGFEAYSIGLRNERGAFEDSTAGEPIDGLGLAIVGLDVILVLVFRLDRPQGDPIEYVFRDGRRKAGLLVHALQGLEEQGPHEEGGVLVSFCHEGLIVLPLEARSDVRDRLEVLVEEDGSIRLIPKLPIDRALAEKYQLADVNWAVKQKGKKK